MLVSIYCFPSALLPTFHNFSFNFPIPWWGGALVIPSLQEVKAQEGKSRLLSPHSGSAVGLGSRPHRQTRSPLPALPHCLLRAITRPLTVHSEDSPCLSPGVRRGRGECGISISYAHFFSTLRFFLEQPDWFPQPGYRFCNYRDEASCHLSAWLLPKICFQFLEDWISSLFFLECLKAMFLTLKKKKLQLPLSSALPQQPGEFGLAFYSVVLKNSGALEI